MESPTLAASRVYFYGFLDRMRRPAAAGLFRSIKSFLASLSLDEPSAEEDGARVQAFYATMEAAFREHPLWANATHQEIDHALEGLEKYIMTKLFDHTFAASAEDAAADTEVSEKIGLLQRFVKPEHLDIPKVLHNEASWLLAAEELQKTRRRKLGGSHTRTAAAAGISRAFSAMLDTPVMPAGEREEETAHNRIFTEFMAGVARFEELVDGGRGFLARFRQELEYFRRPRVSSESDVMGEIVRSNCTDRMKSYLESGCSLHCQNISNLSQLHSCEAELEGYINKVNALLEELQCLVEDAYDATLTANVSAINVPDESTADNKMHPESHFTEEKEEQPAHQLDRDTSLVTVMILVHNMLKLDYTMQEKIVRSLSLKSSSTELDGYCLMWDLRPYVDGNVMDLAWQMCR